MLGAAAFGAGAGLVGGMFSSRSARRAQARLEAQARENERNRVAAEQAYGQEIAAIPEALRESYAFRPVTARTTFGSAGYNPQTGETFVEMAPELSQAAGQYGNLANLEYQQLMGLDRNAMAQQRLQMLNQLQRPQDIAEEERMMSRLQRMGMLGASGEQGNPYAYAMSQAREQRGLQQAYDVTNWVEQNIQNRMRNMQGMYGQQFGTMNLANQNLDVAGNWTERTRRAQLDQANLERGALIAQAEANRSAGIPGGDYTRQMQESIAARGQADQGFIRGITQGAQMMFANPGFSDFLSGGQQPPAPIYTSQPSSMFGGPFVTPISSPQIQITPLPPLY